VAGFRNSNPARVGARFWENLFSDHRMIHLMASTMMSAAVRRQYSLVLPLLTLLASF